MSVCGHKKKMPCVNDVDMAQCLKAYQSVDSCIFTSSLLILHILQTQQNIVIVIAITYVFGWGFFVM